MKSKYRYVLTDIDLDSNFFRGYNIANSSTFFVTIGDVTIGDLRKYGTKGRLFILIIDKHGEILNKRFIPNYL